MITQENVRKRLLERTYAIRQKNIAAETHIPKEIISKFMNGKKDLYPESLVALNNYLDTH